MNHHPPQDLLDDLLPHTGTLSSIVPVSGGITNRNYKLTGERGVFMLRVPGKNSALLGINRLHEYGCAQIADHAGAGAPIVTFLESHQALLATFIPNATTLTSETAADPDRLARIVETIRRFHAAPPFPKSFCPFETVRTYHALALQYGVRFPSDLPKIFELMEELEASLRPHASRCPCHNDFLPGNLLDDGNRIWIVDWEYAGNGNLFFDLGNFSVNLELDEARCQDLVQLYFGKTTPQLMAQLHLMRVASDLREAFWGYLQSGISSLEFDFSEYYDKHLDRFRANAACPSYQEWLSVLRQS